MKKLIKFLLRWAASHFISTSITALAFERSTWSFVVANLAVFLLVYFILEFAFEVKVADLHFEGKKVGQMKDEE